MLIPLFYEIFLYIYLRWFTEFSSINSMSQCFFHQQHEMDVSKNRGTPKWMVYNGIPYKNGWFGGKTHYFWKHPNPAFRIATNSPPKPAAWLEEGKLFWRGGMRSFNRCRCRSNKGTVKVERLGSIRDDRGTLNNTFFYILVNWQGLKITCLKRRMHHPKLHF